MQDFKSGNLGVSGSIENLYLPRHVLEQAKMDFITHFPCTSHGFDSICTFVNCFSNYIYFVTCKESISELKLTWLFLSTVISHHGISSCTVLDHDL